MGKRKRSSKDSDSDVVENLLKKVRKLVRKRRTISSSSDEEPVLESPQPQQLSQPGLASDLEQPDEIPIAEGSVEEEAANSNSDLDPEILELLGTDPTQDKSFGDDLHKDLAIRWKHILLNGLPKEDKANLIKFYLPAENCTHMKAPKLNPEVKSAIGELSFKKDSFSEQKQNQMSTCIAAIGKALNLALSHSQNVPQEIIKTLGDAGRLLCDTHYRESQSRRFAIINSISKQKRDVLKNTKIDGFLFGSDLSEHLRSSKVISRSASELKSYTNTGKSSQQPSTSAPRYTLNARGTPRAQAAAAPRVNPATPRRQFQPPPPPLPPPPPPPAPRDRRRERTNPRAVNYRQQYQRH